MGWNVDAIKCYCVKRVLERYGHADKDTLLDAIAEREAALYPFVTTLGSLDEKTKNGTWADSKLFPARWDDVGDNEVTVWNPETKTYEPRSQPDDADIHKIDYALADSVNIRDGSNIDGKFRILTVHRSEDCAYIHCGTVFMDDVRRACSILKGQNT